MNQEKQIIKWIEEDPVRIQALEIATSLKLDDWCLAAGFVRNLVWDKLHHHSQLTPLNDIDLIYFNEECASKLTDTDLESRLTSVSSLPWSVKNQARMHIRNNDAKYSSTSDAMRHWVEIETAVGAFLSDSGEIRIVAPFGVSALFASSITLNPLKINSAAFAHRIAKKRWLELWPNLKAVYS